MVIGEWLKETKQEGRYRNMTWFNQDQFGFSILGQCALALLHTLRLDVGLTRAGVLGQGVRVGPCPAWVCGAGPEHIAGRRGAESRTWGIHNKPSKYFMAKAIKETCVEAVKEQPEAKGFWYLSSRACKDVFYYLHHFLYKQKNFPVPSFHGRRKEESLWSDLPEDLLDLITLRLYGQDYCSFHDVFRSWRSKGNLFPLYTPSGQSLFNQYLRLVYLEEEDHVLNVLQPLCKGSVIEIQGLSDSRICFSKDGWLLMWQFSKGVFFLNPFTKTRIELPDFPRQQWDYLDDEEGTWDMHLPALSFSSPPFCSDCVVFGISSSCHYNLVSICIIRRGEASWTTYQLQDNNLPFLLSNANPVFHNGLFYCLGEHGNLGIFYPHKGSECNWAVLEHPHGPSCALTIPDGNRFLVQCNGNLFSVFQGRMGKGVFVFSLDPHTMIWNQVHNLEDHMLFLTCQTSLSVKTVKAFDGMGDKIYFPIFPLSYDSDCTGEGTNSCVFYSLATKMYHSFGTDHSSTDISRMKIRINCAWIEPNFVLPSDKDLKWV